MPAPTAEQQLKGFIDKFDEANQKLIRAARKAMRKRLPAANELVYDNYNFFVIGYSATLRPSDAIFSLAAAANGLNLFFLQGARLPDPKGILLGEGKQVRSIRVPSVDVLARADVEDLIAAAVARSRAPLPATGRGELVIRSVSKKQRPRKRAD
jgi:hypothetical protein